jgi:hypothetical protein
MRWWNPDWDAAPVAIGPAPRPASPAGPPLVLRPSPIATAPPRCCTPMVSSDPHRIVGVVSRQPQGYFQQRPPAHTRPVRTRWSDWELCVDGWTIERGGPMRRTPGAGCWI